MTELSEMTTLAVPKEFRKRLHEDFDGGNDFERLKSWAEQEFGYKSSISNEDLLEAIREESNKDVISGGDAGYNDSISVDDVEDAVSRTLSSELPDMLERVMRN